MQDNAFDKKISKTDAAYCTTKNGPSLAGTVIRKSYSCLYFLITH